VRILDTDTCVEILRGNHAVVERIACLEDHWATTWITAGELYFGAARSREPRANADRVTSFLDPLDVLGLDGTSAMLFGEMKALLLGRGERVEDADLMIGAIAAAREAVVVTGNRRHFDRMPGVLVQDLVRP